ncbi:MAG TPA: MlaD family protein [Gemmatimonadaceae bacterium]|nr:MlaD family protein [Gemmatimonadaceae bacterium]
MNRRMNDATVGIAVILVTTALLASLAWVKQADFGHRRRDVVARVRDVGNTRVGNAVVIRGVVAGSVQTIELAPNGWVRIHMKLDRTVDLPSDPVVLLNESSLFGEWQASIEERNALPTDITVRKAIAEATGERGVLPGASFPGIGKLTEVAGQIAGDVANVASRVQTAFDDQAATELRASIKNVSDLSATLSGTVRAHASDLDTVAAQLRSAMAAINATAATVQQIAGRIDTSSRSGDLKNIVDNVAAASTDLRRATAQVNDLAGRFAKSQGRLDTFLANGDSILVKVNSGQGSLGLFVNDPSLYRRSDSLLVVLRSLIVDLKANPGKYIRLHIF